jgi:tRNA (guanine37-N1)-methyltransferase
MKFTVVTLFTELIENFARTGLIGQAVKRELVEIKTLNPREFARDPHHTVDDRAFGGSDGMVMKYEPLKGAVEALKTAGPVHVAVLSPQGELWTQSRAREWSAKGGHVALICGRYAGIDQRFTEAYADEQISLGDFVLNGGEIAACAVIESVARLQPGVLGNQQSAEKDSFSEDVFECPQFTRPREVDGWPVPSPLLSGNHAEIEAFVESVSLVRTALLRPDLLKVKVPLQAHIEKLSRLEDFELRSLGLSRAGLESLAEGRA